MGLKWDKVDFKTNRVKIDRELIISKSKGVHESTTENFYAHIIEENKAKASECIADVLLRKKA